MDLVASYDSEHGEESDVDELKHCRMKRNLASFKQEIDVIDLDSNSEEENVLKSMGTKISNNNSQIISLNSAETLSNSLTSASEKKLAWVDNFKTFPKGSSVPTSDSTDRITDYLNLESSDSDVEADVIKDNINKLINSASVLNEIPCEPSKLNEENIQSFKRSMDSNITLPSAHNTSLDSSIISDVLDIEVMGDNKRFKTDIFTDTKEITNETNAINTIGANVCFLKENECVMKASQENVVCRIPKSIGLIQYAHSNVIMALNWCIPRYSHLYLSASLDGSIKIWDIFHKTPVPVQTITVAEGLSAAKWSLDGGQIYAGGIGKKAYIFDIQSGNKIIEYDIYNYVTSMEVHPYMEDVFLCGTSNAILGFDLRVNSKFPIRSFFSNCKEVLDIAFLDENEFICSTNIVSPDSSDRTIMIWDFSSGAILSNQIYLERYTCPCIRVHPTDSSFVVQTNGNYIAAFSTTRPYKMKNKRYIGHVVAGYGIECDISPDGKYLASGDANGSVFFYNYATTTSGVTNVVKQNCPTNKLKWHPIFPNIMITASYDGQIQIWK